MLTPGKTIDKEFVSPYLTGVSLALWIASTKERFPKGIRNKHRQGRHSRIAFYVTNKKIQNEKHVSQESIVLFSRSSSWQNKRH
jgi:hypothetical protein